MIYKMSESRYNILRLNMNHKEIISLVNDDLCLMNLKQKSIIATDTVTNKHQNINFERIGVSSSQIITDVITN